MFNRKNLGRFIYHNYVVKKLGRFGNRFGPFWSGPFRIWAVLTIHHWFWVTGQRSRSTLALCIRPCGNHSDYSFCPITFKLHMWVVDDERRNPIDLGSRGQRSRSTLALCVYDLVGTIQTTVFAKSLSNFLCKLCMMRGRTLLILGHGVKGQLWHSVYKAL